MVEQGNLQDIRKGLKDKKGPRKQIGSKRASTQADMQKHGISLHKN